VIFNSFSEPKKERTLKSCRTLFTIHKTKNECFLEFGFIFEQMKAIRKVFCLLSHIECMIDSGGGGGCLYRGTTVPVPVQWGLPTWLHSHSSTPTKSKMSATSWETEWATSEVCVGSDP